jgi:hypothetical protein
MVNPVQVTFDAHDPPTLARFWASALGYVDNPPPPGFDSWEDFVEAQGSGPGALDQYAAVIDPDGAGPRLFFQKVPERKTVKNRVHLDVIAPGAGVDDDRHPAIEAFAARLVEAGASRVAAHEQWGQPWVVLQDPEGNEFCVV